jgi:hypothetical protein
MARSSLRGWLGLPSDFLAQGTRHRCRKPCVRLHQFETGPRPWSAVRGVILLNGLRPSGRSHVTSPGSARPLMRLTHVNMNRSRHIIQLSVFPRPAGVHSGRLASQGGTGFGHAFVNSQIYLRGDAAFTMYFGECSARLSQTYLPKSRSDFSATSTTAETTGKRVCSAL